MQTANPNRALLSTAIVCQCGAESVFKVTTKKRSQFHAFTHETADENIQPLFPKVMPLITTVRWPVVRRPHLAVPQRQLEHVGGAAEQTHPQAVQHHPLAAAEHGRGEVSGLQPADEPPEAGGHRLLGGRALHGRLLGQRRGTWWEAKNSKLIRDER